MSYTDRPRAVMYDVARLAGVSHQTVSRVINEHPNVRPETRERVRRAMVQLDYRPNSAARTLAARRSRTIGVISFDGRLFGPSSTMQSIQQVAHAHGYAVVAVSVQGSAPDEVSAAVTDMRQGAVDGFIVVAPRDAERVSLAAVLPQGVPVVALGARLDDVAPMVAIDNEAGGALVAQHLVSLGHRDVAHITGPDDWWESRQRTAGWRACLQESGATERAAWAGDWSARSGYEAGRRLVKRDDVSAVFAANDQMALGVLTALHEAGRCVPRDMAVVGFDNHPDSAWYPPSLTTVEQDFGRVGMAGLTQMVAALEGEKVVEAVLVTPRLVRRTSTARLTG